MFYKFINENTIETAPKPLKIDGKDVFTNSEEIYNGQGYFKLIQEEYPQDEKLYMPVYELKDGVIIQNWVLCTEEDEA